MEDLKNHEYGHIYKITNLINGKIYIGQSINYTKRWKDHIKDSSKINPPSMIGRAIKKYNVENFSFELIEEAYSALELNFLEELYIKKHKSFVRKNGYNLIYYDFGNQRLSEETKLKIKSVKSTKEAIKLARIHGGMNRGKKSDKSLYIGVEKLKTTWRARIANGYGKVVHIGTYYTAMDAAMARDIAELNFYKDKPEYECILNFPELLSKYLNNEIHLKQITKKNFIYNHKQNNKWTVRLKNYITKHFKDYNDAVIYRDECINLNLHKKINHNKVTHRPDGSIKYVNYDTHNKQWRTQVPGFKVIRFCSRQDAEKCALEYMTKRELKNNV